MIYCYLVSELVLVDLSWVGIYGIMSNDDICVLEY